MGRDELSRWRDALIIDRGDLLIESARRWLGEIRTPFNKHDMLRRLEAFMRGKAEAIAGLLDSMDRRVVALVMFAGGEKGLAPEDLTALASDDSGGRPAAAQRVRNLVDRLVLFRFESGDGVETLKVSPPLVTALREALSPYDAVGQGLSPADVPAIDPFSAFCALVSAGAHATPAFKGRYEPSKRAALLLTKTSPAIVEDKTKLKAYLDALRARGMVGDGEGGRPAFDPRRFAQRCESAGAAAVWVLASGAAAANQAGAELRPETLRAAYSCLPRDAALAEPDARRLAAMALAPERGIASKAAAAVDALRGLGMLAMAGDGLFPAADAALLGKAADAAPPGTRRKHSIVVEETHEIRVLPEAEASIRAFVSSVARLESVGLVWSATLDREAARTAYAYGFGAAEIAARLETASGKALPQSVRFSLDAWEREYRSARVLVGAVVVLDGHLSGTLEHAPGAAGIISEKLAEGVYLLDARDRAEAARLLSSVGVEIDTRAPPYRDADDDSDAIWDAGRDGAVGALETFRFALRPPRATLEDGEAPLVKSLLATLDRMAIPAARKAELEDRIRARLVLDEGELTTTGKDDEEPTVGAFDYPGKLRLLEKAMKDGSRVELRYADEAGESLRTAGIPRAIGRTAAGTVVKISAEDGSARSVPVGAISMARRLKQNIDGVNDDGT